MCVQERDGGPLVTEEFTAAMTGFGLKAKAIKEAKSSLYEALLTNTTGETKEMVNVNRDKRGAMDRPVFKSKDSYL